MMMIVVVVIMVMMMMMMMKSGAKGTCKILYFGFQTVCLRYIPSQNFDYFFFFFLREITKERKKLT